MTNQRYALISLSDKTGIIQVASALVQSGVTLLSTGGTYQVLDQAGLPVVSVDALTGFPEMMDGRVKTLHPKVHGGLLALRDNPDHLAAMAQHDISPIDYVIVNLYPFRQTIEKADVTLAQAIENIDIGGPSMLRSAAKNYRSVTVVTDPSDYPALIDQVNTKGQTSPEFRAYLARKVFQLTAHYDALIGDYLLSQEKEAFDPHFDWDFKTVTYLDGTDLRYGENSHQAAKVYRSSKAPSFSLTQAQQLQGKALSYNNYRDGDAAIKIAREFDQPVAVAVKHMNPCGVAIGDTIEQAFDRAYLADPVSIFGGILVFNRPVSLGLAQKLQDVFLEIIIAPEFDDQALAVLKQKKNLRLMVLDFKDKDQSYQEELVSINGGLLVQSSDKSNELDGPDFAKDQELSPEVTGDTSSKANPLVSTDQNGDLQVAYPSWQVMTKRTPTPAEAHALAFNMKVCKHVKSNAIVVGNGTMTLGIGAGQMNRIGSAIIALKQAGATLDQDPGQAQPLVMASDAFFPMDDTVSAAIQAGVTAIIQPGGSIKDQDSVAVCDQYQVAMVKTGLRHFKH